MKVFKSEALKVIYKDSVDLYKSGVICKEKLKEKKIACMVDRPLFDFSRFASNAKKLIAARTAL
ncbi:MAG: hypothetical protein Ta2C_10750 [Candidatus Endomicrobiellum trichonymphae]|uniref:hypothetical protein n=1 Tax=Endomicrobium trichonymphae TaxID=1408204 RepID=UPI0027D4212C|nr:MAG: hypothetical protein Ta2C_10750 [Candidatus Endomicrobium trichonymphae]